MTDVLELVVWSCAWFAILGVGGFFCERAERTRRRSDQ
jgi:hypothetical protein